MATMTPTRSPATTKPAGFGRVVRAEWTKLRSVWRWMVALLAALVACVLFSLLAASESSTDANEFATVLGPDGTPVRDEFRFVHQPLTGDGSIVVRVASGPDSSNGFAGVMVKESTEPGAPYAAMMLGADGVQMSANFDTEIDGSASSAPRWLRLTRSGDEITGSESPDGREWTDVGTVEMAGLPETAETGYFVSSLDEVIFERSAGSTSISETPTQSTATFDNVQLDGRSDIDAWQTEDIVKPGDPAPALPTTGTEATGESVEVDGTFVVTGVGEIGPERSGDDIVANSLQGVLFGLLPIIAVGVLFVTSEYKRGLIRTSFAAVPSRGRVLAAKALVLGGASFAVALPATVLSFLLAQSVMRDNGFAPPAYPEPDLFDPTVLRVVVGTAVFVAVVAVLSLSAGAILRHGAAAITLVFVLVVMPTIVAAFLSSAAAIKALMLLTPAGGFATQRAQPASELHVEPASLINWWAGLGVASAYAVGAFVVAVWLVRRRDA